MKTLMNKNERGFTLLFAVLVSSLVLAIGLSIANLTLKEVKLSGAGRESEFAFYAADTGSECALYWDIKGYNVFATSADSLASPPVGPVGCVGEDIVTGDSTSTPGVLVNADGINAIPWNICTGSTCTDGSANPDVPSQYTATTTFEILFPEGYCAVVKVGKNYNTSDGSEFTDIDSRGYNTCNPASGLRTERGFQVTY